MEENGFIIIQDKQYYNSLKLKKFLHTPLLILVLTTFLIISLMITSYYYFLNIKNLNT